MNWIIRSIRRRAIHYIRRTVTRRVIRRVTLKGRDKEYRAYKEKARELAVVRLAHFNVVYGFTYGRIAIRNTKSRWGSCSKKGNLNFSYKIALIAPELADYVIVHELCHIGQFNHSRAFWELVERTVPDWRDRRKRMHASMVA